MAVEDARLGHRRHPAMMSLRRSAPLAPQREQSSPHAASPTVRPRMETVSEEVAAVTGHGAGAILLSGFARRGCPPWPQIRR